MVIRVDGKVFADLSSSVFKLIRVRKICGDYANLRRRRFFHFSMQKILNSGYFNII